MEDHFRTLISRVFYIIRMVMVEKIQKSGNLKGTRWVPHLHRALKIFLKDFKVIHFHFHNTVAAGTSSIEMQGRAKKF